MMVSSARYKVLKQCRLTLHAFLFVFQLSIIGNSVAQTQIVITASDLGKFHFETVSPLTKSNTFTVDFPLHTTVLVNAKTSIAYLFSPQGWIVALDLQHQQLRQKSRITSQISAMAISEEGDYLMLANDEEHTLLAVQTETLQAVRRIAMRNTAGQVTRIASLHHAAPRQSFIAVMRDFPELWEMSYNSNAEPVYQGLVHDYQMGEGIADKNPLRILFTRLCI
jgi:hypothetical protein